MYFPYLRGKQYELLALRELVEKKLISPKIFPIVEPVKLTPTFFKTLQAFIDQNRNIGIVVNSQVKSDSMLNIYSGCKEKIDMSKISLVQIIEKGGDVPESLGSNWIYLIKNRDSLPLYEQAVEVAPATYSIIDDNRTLRRAIPNNKILIEDPFEKKVRNADYLQVKDEFFSETHTYFQEEGYVGYSDYSIIGKEFTDSGFAPRAVAIHIVYFDTDNSIRIKHFTSDSNDDIDNVAGKFYEALRKLHRWYTSLEDTSMVNTAGLHKFLQHYEEKSYPGLGSVKKYSIMHHLEMISNYFLKYGE